MANYFPYSYIITGIYNNIKEAVYKYAYVGDGQIFENKSDNNINSGENIISELYY